jgi:glycosyltransferase involved in cell wall biosynthesis
VKIAYFNYLFDLYGASIGSTIKGIKLMEALRKCGHEVKIYWRKDQPSANGHGEIRVQSQPRRFVARHLSRFVHEPNQLLSNLRYLREERRILAQDRPDLLVARLDLYLFSAVKLAKQQRLPLVLEVDSPEAYEFRTFYSNYWRTPNVLEAIEAYNIQNADACVTVSNKLADYFQTQSVTKERMHVVSNGADLSKFNPNLSSAEVRAKYGLHNAIVIGFIGSFHYWHGVDNLIALIKAATANNASVKFLMVGDGGAMKSQLQKFVAENNLAQRVVLTGHVAHDEVGKHVAAMDIVLAPYPALEFFYYSPVKIFEYLACGKPVLSSRLGQIQEIISDGVNGFLSNPGDNADYSRKLARLIDDAELRQRIGVEAYQTIARQHTWEHKARAWSEICESVLRKHCDHGRTN